MDILNDIIKTTLDSFDFTFCIIVNLLTYFIIKIIDEVNGDKTVGTWTKRIVLLCVITSTGVVEYMIGLDAKLILNSAILSPVFWSWICKPICNKLNIDYKHYES